MVERLGYIPCMHETQVLFPALHGPIKTASYNFEYLDPLIPLDVALMALSTAK